MKNLKVVILAAGKSKRMKSRISKVMHPLVGKPVIEHVITTAKELGRTPLVVISPSQKDLKDELKKKSVPYVYQRKAIGTANAVQQTKPRLSHKSGHLLILCGDVPLIRKETLDNFVKKTILENITCSVLSMELPNPAGYGRIVRDLDNLFVKIVEDKDTDDEAKKIAEVNTGIICAEKKWLFETLKKIKPNNHQKEYYLTDIVSLAIAEGKKTTAIKAPDPDEFIGINTRADLALASNIMRDRINSMHMANGVTIINPAQTYIDINVQIGADTVIWPGVFLLGKTSIGNCCTIENGAVLKNTKLSSNVWIKSYSIIEESEIDTSAAVGPFARMRPGSKIGKGAKVGNFVEIKKSSLGDGAKANHLSYLGDALIGSKVNIGCGTITCNYDGLNKYKTIIGDGSFIGSDTQFVAPVRIGKGSTIGAGSTITKDVPNNALALSRAPQVIVKNWGKRSKKRKKS